jgi:hypothetical protein
MRWSASNVDISSTVGFEIENCRMFSSAVSNESNAGLFIGFVMQVDFKRSALQ